MKTRNIYSLMLFFICSVVTAQNSLLSTGTWVKMEIKESGLYKINYDQLKTLGFVGKNPKNIKIYGYGEVLPQKNSDFRYDDMAENQIIFNGEEDGIINENDFILFYAQGPNKIDSLGKNLQLKSNPYTLSSFYFISYSESAGKRINTFQNSTSYSKSFNYLPFIAYHEDNAINIIKSGREWVGNSFKLKSNYTFSFNLEDINTNLPVLYSTKYVGGSFSYPTSFTTFINNIKVKDTNVGTIPNGYGLKAQQSIHAGSTILSNATLAMNCSYDNKSDGSANAFIDKIEINYLRYLTGNKTRVYTLPTFYQGAELEITNTSANTRVWDVTKVTEIKQLALVNGKVNVDIGTDVLLIANQNDVKSPIFAGVVGNQNIHALDVPELLIVTHENFRASANAFADFKNKEQKINTKVVTVQEIYNEFSSGKQDITAIRDFAKYLYKKDNTFKYLLLFGDCSYDYLNRLSANTNYVPVYESYESFDNIDSFSSDDYFGFFDDHEGEWPETYQENNHLLEIGIGRLPIKSNEEGYSMLNKVKNYVYSTNSKGSWRNKAMFVADDGDYQTHSIESNDLSIQLNKIQNGINETKVYLDAFEQVSSSGGQVAPLVNEAIKRRLDNGLLLVNYTGHGGEEQWAQEQIFTIDEINKLNNKNKLPFFITATCEFGRYDDPTIESGSERFLLNSNGGAIGLMTTTRAVFGTKNFILNTAFYDNVFKRNSDSLFDRIGDIHKRTKNESISGINNRNFALLGDPSIKLAYPEYKVIADSVNNKIIYQKDTLSALEKIKIKGHINNPKGVKDINFNGKVSVSIYDKQSEVTTLGDENATPFNYKERKSIIFEGEVDVKQGEFKVEFVVPKDISYTYGLGKMSFYALSNAGLDASGCSEDIYIGGGLDGFSDNLGPELDLFVNDTTFISGSVVSSNCIFIAKIFDENGVNTTNSGIGHEMTLIIDDNPDLLYILNEYYKSVNSTYKNGLVSFPLFNLSPGYHKLTFKIWDVNNNSSEEDIYINVSESGMITAYPNPFNEKVNFIINQPRKDVGGQFEMKILNIFGDELYNQIVDFDEFTSIIDNVSWDGKKNNGENITPGIYFSVSELRYRDGLGNITEKTKLLHQK